MNKNFNLTQKNRITTATDKNPEKNLSENLSEIFSKNLTTALDSVSKTRKDIATSLDISEDTLRKYEKGEAYPRIDFLIRVYEKYHINPLYLLGIDSTPDLKTMGEISMLVQNTHSSARHMIECSLLHSNTQSEEDAVPTTNNHTKYPLDHLAEIFSRNLCKTLESTSKMNKDIALALDVTEYSLRNYKKGTTIPKIDFLVKLYIEYTVNPLYLLEIWLVLDLDKVHDVCNQLKQFLGFFEQAMPDLKNLQLSSTEKE